MTLIDLAKSYDIEDYNEFKNFKKIIKKKLNFNAESDTMILSRESEKEIEHYLRHCYRNDIKQEKNEVKKTDKQANQTKSNQNRTSKNNSEKKEKSPSGNKGSKNNTKSKAKNGNEINLGSYDETVSILKKCIKNKYIVLLDTCIFLETPVEKLTENILTDMFLEAGIKYTVPAKVVNELEKHSKSHPEERKKKRAAVCLNFINKGIESGMIEILVGAIEEKIHSKSSFADPYIYNIVEQKVLFEKKNVLALTTDSKLMKDIMSIKERKSIQYKKEIMVKAVSPKGYLCNVIDFIRWRKQKK